MNKIIFSKSILDKLHNTYRSRKHVTFHLLGKDDKGIIRAAVEIPAADHCYTPEVPSSSFAGAMISLDKAGYEVAGVYIVDTSASYPSYNETVNEWYRLTEYTRRGRENVLGDKGTILVKEGKHHRTTVTAGVVKSYHELIPLQVETVEIHIKGTIADKLKHLFKV